jgi:hypothetical protein
LLATFNILAFLFHTLLDLTDQKYQLVRQTFFDDLRALTSYIFFDSWNNLLDFMILGLELEFPPLLKSHNENCCSVYDLSNLLASESLLF